MSIPFESRVLGSFLGGAVGDALGAEVEFLRWDAIEHRYGIAGIEAFDGPGHITDDTQMALFTAEGLIRGANRVIDQWSSEDPPYLRVRATCGETMYRAYLRWYSTQGGSVRLPADRGWLVDQRELHVQRAPGRACMSALASGTAGSVTSPINNSKGCGGVMRVHPVGLVAGADAFRLGAEAAAITHGHTTGYLAAAACAAIIARVIAGDDLPRAVVAAQRYLTEWGAGASDDTQPRLTGWEEGAHPTLEAIAHAVALAETEPVPDAEVILQLGEGWIAEEALAISLYCALTAADVRGGIVAAVNHSGDSDSTGAITGALLGALLGADAVPSDWVEPLAERALVETVAHDLIAHFPQGDAAMAYDVDRYPPN